MRPDKVTATCSPGGFSQGQARELQYEIGTCPDHEVGGQARDCDISLAAVVCIHSEGTLEVSPLFEPLAQLLVAGICWEPRLLGDSGRACCTDKQPWLDGQQALTLQTAVHRYMDPL